MSGWSLETLEVVTDDPETMERLEQLISKSLAVIQESGSEMKYFMLETIRQYACEKLFDARGTATTRDRHFDYFNNLSEKMWEAFRSENILPMVPKLKDEAENLRAAMEWGLQNHTEENVRLAANFCRVSELTSAMSEGMAVAKKAVERVRSLPEVIGEADRHRQRLIARALYMQGMMSMEVGNKISRPRYRLCGRALPCAAWRAINKCWATAWKCTSTQPVSLIGQTWIRRHAKGLQYSAMKSMTNLS